MKSLHEHMTNLRDALLELSATGAEGFEGLLAVTLTRIANVPFRLAHSGSQFGLDGKTAYATDGVYFEGKRYDGRIPRADVLSKIAELSIGDKGDVDLWVLGATTGVGSQLTDDVHALGDRNGISTLVLDWSDTGLPPLAVALAMAGSVVDDFLRRHLKNGDLVSKASQRRHPPPDRLRDGQVFIPAWQMMDDAIPGNFVGVGCALVVGLATVAVVANGNLCQHRPIAGSTPHSDPRWKFCPRLRGPSKSLQSHWHSPRGPERHSYPRLGPIAWPKLESE